MSDLFDQAVRSESFQQAGDLAGVFAGRSSAQVFVLQAADVELAANDGLEQFFVVRDRTG